ncbi:hypothetical protein WMY93_018217 [Mugilogobius chulae]|uniref:Homeobox domain-containing protein n=1 Tax=Mugilogobius chulae TaxID=88201 RepID=A0AAW0NKY9_9GOBI
MGIDQALTSAPFTYANEAVGGDSRDGIKTRRGPEEDDTSLQTWTYSRKHGQILSVDWLAQSHSDSSSSNKSNEARTEESELDKTFKPHVPCMVQPSAPSYGKGYLQPKPKSTKSIDAETVFSSPRSSCASPISETSEYSSGYESEAASSECSASDDVSEAEKDAQNQRRVRTKFTPDQINKLEKIFLKHKYLDAGERVKTAQKLNLTETQVRTWFQNRRMKLKREVQDFLTPQVPPMLLHGFPPALPYQRPNYYPHPPSMVLLRASTLCQSPKCPTTLITTTITTPASPATATANHDPASTFLLNFTNTEHFPKETLNLTVM